MSFDGALSIIIEKIITDSIDNNDKRPHAAIEIFWKFFVCPCVIDKPQTIYVKISNFDDNSEFGENLETLRKFQISAKN